MSRHLSSHFINEELRRKQRNTNDFLHRLHKIVFLCNNVFPTVTRQQFSCKRQIKRCLHLVLYRLQPDIIRSLQWQFLIGNRLPVVVSCDVPKFSFPLQLQSEKRKRVGLCVRKCKNSNLFKLIKRCWKMHSTDIFQWTLTVHRIIKATSNFNIFHLDSFYPLSYFAPLYWIHIELRGWNKIASFDSYSGHLRKI